MTAPGKITNRNRRTGIILAGVAAGMVGLSFAAVPLYQIFCQVTGFGGTTQRSTAAPGKVLDRIITVRFNADTASSLPWQFRAKQGHVKVRVGEETLAYYEAVNTSGFPATGTATFNVTPLKAGQYFVKVECFCFRKQTLAPGESVDMPVSFYVDPEIVKDRNLDDVKTITLSYTFYQSRDVPKRTAVEETAVKESGANSAGN